MTSKIGDKSHVGEMFDRIAPTYDRLNHLLSFNIDRIWRKRTIKMTASAQPSLIIDIAAGTADLSIGLAKRIPSAHITGIDLSEGMLEIGRMKVAEHGLTGRIELIHANAQQLPFDNESFDVATIGFGIRNFEDVESGLREMRRVLKKGGEAFILEFSMPQGKIFGQLYRFYFHRILPFFGRMISKDAGAYTYLPDSVDEFPDKLLFLQLMGDAGFAGCTAKRLMRGVAYIYKGVKL